MDSLNIYPYKNATSTTSFWAKSGSCTQNQYTDVMYQYIRCILTVWTPTPTSMVVVFGSFYADQFTNSSHFLKFREFTLGTESNWKSPEKSMAQTPLWCCPFNIETACKFSASQICIVGSLPTYRKGKTKPKGSSRKGWIKSNLFAWCFQGV